MAYSYWDTTSVYHSHIRKATEDNAGISFMLTSGVKLSKDKVNKIVQIAPYGDESRYWLQAENEAIAAQLEALPQDVWLIVKAHGSHDSAVLEVTDVDGNPIDTAAAAAVPQTAPPPRVPQGPTGIKPPSDPNTPAWQAASRGEQPAVPPSTPSQPPAPASTEPPVPAGIPVVQDRRDKLDSDMLDCILRAHEIVDNFKVLHSGDEPTDLVQRVGVSLFINDH